MTRIRWYLATVLAVVSVLLASVPALAVDPPTLTQTVTDQTGKLAGGEGRIQAAADTLKSENDLTFYVLFIPQLDGEDPATFIDRVAAANKLGDGRNVMFMVSLNDRKDAVWSSGLTSVEANELPGIRERAEDRLRAGDFVGAVETAAVGFGNAEAAVDVPQPQQPSVPTVPSKPVDFTPFGIVLLIVLLCGVGGTVLVIAYTSWRARSDRLAVERAEQAKMEELGKKAHRALMESDEQVRQAETELAFAETEFGAEEMEFFRTALGVAKKELQAAFKVGQEIDDDIPETYAERNRMLADITTRTSGIKAALDGAMERVEGLRDLEHTAAATVEKLRQQKGQRTKALTKAQEQVDQLDQHGKSVVDSVEPNIKIATAIYAKVDQDLEAAQKSIDAGKLADAAILVRDVQESLAKANNGLDNIAKLADSLATAERNLDVQIQTADADIIRAAVEAKANDVAGLSSKLTDARAALAKAKAEAVSDHADVIVAYNHAVRASNLADEVLAGVRSEQERRQRARDQAESQLRSAEVAIAQANAYIERNRRTVGRKARNRLSEAQRQYDEATRIRQTVSQDDTNIFLAATAAVQASEMADNAYRYAREDVSEAQSVASAASYGGSSHSSGGSYGSSSSGSSSSSSSSGSSWSHSDNSFSIGSFGGGSSGGSFGGGGGSSSGGGW